MLSIELKVNSQLVSHIYSRNIEHVERETYSYTYEYYEIESGKVVNGNVLHHRPDGLRKLVSIILDDIDLRNK